MRCFGAFGLFAAGLLSIVKFAGVLLRVWFCRCSAFFDRKIWWGAAARLVLSLLSFFRLKHLVGCCCAFGFVAAQLFSIDTFSGGLRPVWFFRFSVIHTSETTRPH